MPQIQTLLREKVGPIPVWGYGVIGGGMLVTFIYLKKRNANAAAQSAVLSAPYSGGIPGPTGGDAGGSSGTVSVPTDNSSAAGTPTLSDLYTSMSTWFNQLLGVLQRNGSSTSTPTTPTSTGVTPPAANGSPLPSGYEWSWYGGKYGINPVGAGTQTNVGTPPVGTQPAASAPTPSATIPPATTTSGGTRGFLDIPNAMAIPGQLNIINSPGGTVPANTFASFWEPIGPGPGPGGFQWQQWNTGEYVAPGEKLGILYPGVSLPGGLTARPGSYGYAGG